MKKIRLSYLRWGVLALLFAFVWFASISSEIGEWYAVVVYPWLSKFLSGLASLVGFSVDDWGVVGAVLLLVMGPFYWRIRRGKGWLVVAGREVEMVLWVYVWFYWGWGMNYYRASFFHRAEVRPVVYDEARFDRFLSVYMDGLDRAFRDCQREGWMEWPGLFQPMVDNEVVRNSSCSMALVHEEIKAGFMKVPARYGLCRPTSYQWPKRSSFNGLYSNVGVLGFMGPFFAESHLNLELSGLEYPFTYAHELSHLLGVSSEAEANLWAFMVCSQSRCSLIRLSGYVGLLSYVRSNALYLLSAADFEKWENRLAPELKAAFYRVHAYWALRYNPVLGEMQSALYSFYLKRNKISSGQKNYAQVVGLLLALPDFRISF